MEPRGGHLELPRVMEILRPWVLNISTDGDSTASLGSLCQRLTNLTVEKVFYCVQMPFPTFSSVSIVPSADTTEKIPVPSLLHPPLQIFTYITEDTPVPPSPPG